MQFNFLDMNIAFIVFICNFASGLTCILISLQRLIMQNVYKYEFFRNSVCDYGN